MIVLQDVSKLYHDNMHALRNVTFHIEKGECCFILGPSGAGKTTLLKILYAMERPTSGQLSLFERNTEKLGFHDIQALRRHMGFIFQDYRLIDDWSVYDNAAVILQILGKSSGYIHSRVWQMLKWVGLQHKVYDRAGDLSGGEKQRLAIVRAIIHDPDILLADEPVGSLDDATARYVMNMFHRLHRKGTTLVIASHREDPFIDFARVIALDRGRLVGG
ncbi:MAG: Cell division ATP-binding protein FtsE [Deltaproteobacteria bacterium ADurb.BinA179]|jgi:cell division transport system ATP-binding protein|nr:MAG: Cell division ATP-binding protein FtsE [Deltaproteobacteria bacterium ADurb.BinA179]HNU73742.1 ATP-binding cassette domain-containing protein [Deltaproteobacteria bacterium]HOD69565.1 ATP-binding cassette domain-containing protein [Deltaproteobacteria bacterium]HOE74191.1 ATP-binding cassette domain-containing protein [Deltaproteobacteria bacterium]HPV28573.1 ATP-binding cassette domain-containing protein [Deltaproteobacteria bacterium]